MPVETLTAKLQFQGDAAIAGMNRASGAFTKMRAHAKLAKEGVQNLKKGFAGFNIVAAGVAAGVTASVKKFGDFEGQIAAVAAVLGKDAAPQISKLEQQALQLGATTSFTAKQSAEAMESLARAGFDTVQIMKTVPQVLDAAAAESMDLATAADIVASNIKAFQLEAKDAARVADALAFVSSKTNTNMVGLQEGMKFVAPVAKQMGIDLEDTAAALGALADVGLKGTLAGTGLKNALLKISKQAKGGKVPIGKYSAEIVKTASGGIDLAKTMFNVTGALQKIKEPTARAQAAMKLMGLRGMGSAAAFDALGKNQKLVNALFVDMRKNAKGVASEMARVRLKGFHGDLVRVGSAIDGAAVALGKFISPKIQPFIKNLTTFLGDVAKAFGVLGEEGKSSSGVIEKKLSKLNQTAVAFVKGFKEGVQSAKKIFGVFVGALKIAFGPVKALFSSFGFLGGSGPGVQGMTKLAIQAAALGLAIKTATSLFSRFAAVAKGSFQILKGVLGGIKTGVQGTVSFLSAKIPAIARILPASMRKLTGAVTAAEKITAQPVRIVNFDEMGMLPGAIPGAAPGAAPGTVAATKGATAATKTAGALEKVASALAAGVAGYAVGTYIDQLTDASGKLAKSAEKLPGFVSALHPVAAAAMGLGPTFEAQAKTAVEARRGGTMRKFGAMLLPGFVKEAKAPETTKFAKAGGALSSVRLAAAREAARKAEAAITTSPKIVAMVMAGIKPLLDTLPTKSEWKAITKGGVTILTVNGREVARATVESQVESQERTGAPMRSAKPRTAAKR